MAMENEAYAGRSVFLSFIYCQHISFIISLQDFFSFTQDRSSSAFFSLSYSTQMREDNVL
jgi:hypothetical protein